STITINNVTGNQTNFKGYQIFKATVTDGANGKTVSNITWANDDVKAAVVNAIKGQDSSYAGTTAQDAADWITAHVNGTNNTTVVDADSAANAIAKAVEGLTTTTTVKGGQTSDALDSGYWLFVTDPASVDATGATKDGETFTSPIFAVVGGSAYTVTEKASIPTVEKKIVSDADGAEHDAADSHIGQNVTYNIYGTVAQDFATYDSYSYKFTDTISKGLTIDTDAKGVPSNVKVYMYTSKDAAKADLAHTKGTDVTSHFTIALSAADATTGAHDLTVTASDAKGLKSIDGATKDSVFVVTYTAKINSDAVIGNNGNPNTVKLTYSNNPHSNGTGNTVEHHVKDFTYGLNLVKVDQGTEQALAGAKFTIQVSSADDSASTGKYVQSDGKLGDTAYEFTTNDQGKIDVTGLDAGTYKVHEVSAPSGYSTVSDFTFTIDPTIDEQNQTITKLESTLNTSDPTHVIAGLSDGTAGDNTLTAKTGSGVTDNKTVNITVGDTKSVGLPLTGQAGVTLTWVAGGLVLAFGVSRVVRNRHENDAE
ncbi:MAG: isopeptide-forming domain-containing fimbrial protein, partial [Atopobiaceae bacterium]